MTSEPSSKSTDAASSPVADATVTGVTEVVNAALDLGAVLAKTVAQVTSGDRPVPPSPSKGGPIEEMVFYGVTAINNVINLAISGAGVIAQSVSVAEEPQTSEPSQTATYPPTSTAPKVHQGSTLRVPLSIENQGREPMNGMTFVCLSVESETTAAGQSIDKSAVRFQPQTMNVAPKDFEKLVVFVDTTPNTAPGHYKITIGLGDGIFENRLTFEVVPANSAD
jgi:hypothetical protein